METQTRDVSHGVSTHSSRPRHKTPSPERTFRRRGSRTCVFFSSPRSHPRGSSDFRGRRGGARPRGGEPPTVAPRDGHGRGTNHRPDRDGTARIAAGTAPGRVSVCFATIRPPQGRANAHRPVAYSPPFGQGGSICTPTRQRPFTPENIIQHCFGNRREPSRDSAYLWAIAHGVAWHHH